MLKKLLIGLLLLSFFLPACAGNDNSKIDETKNNVLENIETEPSRFMPNLPARDFGGYEFRVAIPDPHIHATMTAVVEEETGDLVNDAIYRRNMYIEEKFNVKFREILIGHYNDSDAYFQKSVMAQSDDFDTCLPLNTFKFAIEGYVLTVDQLPYMDITQPWYMHDLCEAYAIGGKYFFAYNDECLSVYESHIAVCFNKKLAEDLTLENMYSLVDGGKWTHEKLFDMCRTASYDVDGDGQMTDADQYGVVGQDDQFLMNFWISAGIKVVTKDSDGYFMYNRATEDKLETVLTNVYNNLYARDKIYFAAGIDKLTVLTPENNIRDVSTQQFRNDSSLFYVTRLLDITAMRGMETDFGVIPFPKFDEKQDKYYPLSYSGWLKVAPIHAPDAERTSIIIEVLAAESRNTTVPAYKELALGVKYIRDNESAEMLDLIFNNGVFDQGVSIFNYQIRSVLIEVMNGKSNYASAIEKNMEKWDVMFDEYNNAAKEAINK